VASSNATRSEKLGFGVMFRTVLFLETCTRLISLVNSCYCIFLNNFYVFTPANWGVTATCRPGAILSGKVKSNAGGAAEA
jgi:hypothetical protein